MSLTAEEIESWAREAEKHQVRVKYRVKGQEQASTKTMAHVEYLRWVADMDNNGYQLVSAEQVRTR